MNFIRFLKNPLFSIQKFGRTLKKSFFLKTYNKKINLIRNNNTCSDELDILFKDTRHFVENDIDKIRVISLKILKMIDFLSKKHDFSYFMSYGTLIGVVRHQGFIPWDDDIDIMMTKKDLDTFIQVSNQLPDTLNFFPQGLNFFKVMDNYSKISLDGKRGVAVDIFLLSDDHEGFNFVNVHNHKMISLRKFDIFPLVYKSFEGLRVPIPTNYHSILTKIYGDYMKLPPLEQQISNHVNNTSVHIFPFPRKNASF